jgi:uncharacterized repeat protein (TIGR03803 family)
MNSGGTLTTLQSSSGTPYGGLIQATNGNLYATTYNSGANGLGTVFEITPTGMLTTIYSFGATDGDLPVAGLVQATKGDFYGTTSAGGDSCGGLSTCGTVFSLSVGLGPFVETQTTSGKVGAVVKILGNELTGATGVSFNGIAAEFKVSASSLITTIVPVGASTGTVQVMTPRRHACEQRALPSAAIAPARLTHLAKMCRPMWRSRASPHRGDFPAKCRRSPAYSSAGLKLESSAERTP